MLINSLYNVANINLPSAKIILSEEVQKINMNDEKEKSKDLENIKTSIAVILADMIVPDIRSESIFSEPALKYILT